MILTRLGDCAIVACLKVYLKIKQMILDSTGKKADIFDGKARVLHTGTEFGCVHPKDPRFADQIGRIQKITGQNRILAQKLKFNTRVTPVGRIEDLEQGNADGFYRTPEVSDGVVVSLTGETLLKIAVMIMNADCGTIEILAPNGEMAVLHGAFECVDNKDGSSIVRNAIKYFESRGIPAKDLRFRMGEAAQACCYGFNAPAFAADNKTREERIKGDYGPDVVRPVRNLPRSRDNGIGFDVPLIAAKQADQEGIRDIEVEGLCTSCHGLIESAMGKFNTFGTWYSNLREDSGTVKDRGYGMRNAVVVY